MKEIWKDVVGFEGLYKISDLGNIKSSYSGKTLKMSSKCNSGYYIVNLYKDKKPKNVMVHQVVAVAFLGHKPCGQEVTIDHIDGNRLNNKVSNLQLVNQRINTNKSVKIGKSGYRGVVWSTINNKWQVRPRINGKKTHFDYYDSPEIAAKEYDSFTKYIDGIDTSKMDKKQIRLIINKYKQKLKDLKNK